MKKIIKTGVVLVLGLLVVWLLIPVCSPYGFGSFAGGHDLVLRPCSLIPNWKIYLYKLTGLFTW